MLRTEGQFAAILGTDGSLNEVDALVLTRSALYIIEMRHWQGEIEGGEAKDKVLETGAEGVDAARHLGKETFGRGRSVMGKLSSGIAERAFRQRRDDEK
jgi:hypothetical protein